MLKKQLVIFGLSEEDTIFLKATLEKTIDEELNISRHIYKKNMQPVANCSVVLTTGSFLINEAKQMYPGSRVITAKRIMTGLNLEQVMMLPEGQKVLVANNPKEVTVETIRSLQELGLNHLQYVPYWENEDVMLDGIKTAISPGHSYLIPEKITERIDLGRRTLSFSTFIELLTELDLDLKNVDNFAKNHIQLMVDAGNKIVKLYYENEKISDDLQVVLSKIQNAVFALDREGCISVFNTAAEELFSLDKSEVLGKKYREIFKIHAELLKILNKTGPAYEEIITVKNRKILVSMTYSPTQGTKICTLDEVANIQKIEENVRRSLYAKGHIARYNFATIKGGSEVMGTVIEKARKFAGKDLTVLIHGKSGTGKEIFAQAIHNASQRAKEPFIAINFASVANNLVESELFGYVEGAFTGAAKGGKTGIFEQAHKGTIFLDEIGDTPLSVQTSLLRVLQEKEVMRVGSLDIIPVDVRIIAATNKNLLELVEKGRFREDLYYRLKVLALEIPPLKERKEDIPEIIESMLVDSNEEIHFNKEAMDALLAYDWPGNVRELSNFIKYITAVCDDSVVTLHDIPHEFFQQVDEKVNTNIRLNTVECTHSDEILFLLCEIYRNNKKGVFIGREKLLEVGRAKNLQLTEAKIKTRLRQLETDNFIRHGRTKQGSFITPAGIGFLKQYGLL